MKELCVLATLIIQVHHIYANVLANNISNTTYLDSVGSYSSAYQRSFISFGVNLQENFTPRYTDLRSHVC